MPSKTTLFSHQCKPIADFGTAPRNTLRWSPNGRLLCIGGFGNLQGDMDFWDPKTVKKVGTANASNSSFCEWSPDGKYFLTAILTPRLRVDNGFKLWNHEGTFIYGESLNELYQVVWQPALPGTYPNKAYVFTKKEEQSTPKAAASSSSAPAAKYRHPNHSGVSVSIRQEEAPQKYVPPTKPTEKLPPGYAPNKNQEKKRNNVKREKSKKKQQRQNQCKKLHLQLLLNLNRICKRD